MGSHCICIFMSFCSIFMLIIELCICTYVLLSSRPVVRLSSRPVCPGFQSVQPSKLYNWTDRTAGQLDRLDGWTDWTTGQPDDIQIYNWTTVQLDRWRTSLCKLHKNIAHISNIQKSFNIITVLIYSLKSGVIILKP